MECGTIIIVFFRFERRLIFTSRPSESRNLRRLVSLWRLLLQILVTLTSTKLNAKLAEIIMRELVSERFIGTRIGGASYGSF